LTMFALIAWMTWRDPYVFSLHMCLCHAIYIISWDDGLLLWTC